MSKSSKESLFGITLAELVIILFFIMLLLSIFNIDKLREEVSELTLLVPGSEEGIVSASEVVELLIPDGEINSDLIPLDIIREEIQKLQEDKKELEDMKSLVEGEGDGDCREGGFWITSKCADHCWEISSAAVNREYEYLFDIGVCESSVVVQKSDWIEKTDQDFSSVEGATEMLDQGVMTPAKLFAHLDIIKEPGYNKKPRQCFYSVRIIDLGARSIARWESIEQEIANRAGRLPVDEGDRIYPEIRRLFPEDICDVKPAGDNIRKASLVSPSFVKAFVKHRSCRRIKSSELQLLYSIELDRFGKPGKINLINSPEESSRSQDKLVNIATDALRRANYTPEYVEDVAVPSILEKTIKIQADACDRN